ncbi:SMI1/KNR4 family protein [Nonomuraea sediminis]|uniref:SMI1/KNR4 family protein n=1 Tax=Nonomuraea sediminis TaxID=2835864 RepID=UPI001BDBE570|nr:SMI1/KNR4 family protein [Nonomuraea sediminis]
MIGLKLVRRALPLILLAGAATSSAARYGDSKVVMCSFGGGGDTISIDCGDPKVEAAMRARILTPDQARAAGCRPLTVESENGTETPDLQPSFEPTPTPPVSPRVLDTAVAGRVNAAWDRIDRWLGAHASATLRKLRFPATGTDLDGLEEYRGARLPDDLYASLLRHDGADGNFGAGLQLPSDVGLAGVQHIWTLTEYRCMDLVMGGWTEEADPDHASLIPVGSTGNGTDLFIDQRTGQVGEHAYGKALSFDGPMGWSSYTALLEAVADSLERGAKLRDWYPVVQGCELRWATAPAPLPGGCAGGPRPTLTPTPTPTPTETKLTAGQARAMGCRPGHRAPVVRTPGRTVTSQVAAEWRRIERWLAREAPKTYRSLPGPARAVDIARVEAAMGARFPDDLRASLLRHDGGGEFGPEPFYAYMPVKAMHADWKMLCDIIIDGGDDSGSWWDGHLIPFADSGDGGNLFLDPRTGKTGEYYNEDGLTTDGDVAWPSYLALLRDTAAALESGRPLRGWRATVSKGRLDWKEAPR